MVFYYSLCTKDLRQNIRFRSRSCSSPSPQLFSQNFDVTIHCAKQFWIGLAMPRSSGCLVTNVGLSGEFVADYDGFLTLIPTMTTPSLAWLVLPTMVPDTG